MANKAHSSASKWKVIVALFALTLAYAGSARADRKKSTGAKPVSLSSTYSINSGPTGVTNSYSAGTALTSSSIILIGGGSSGGGGTPWVNPNDPRATTDATYVSSNISAFPSGSFANLDTVTSAAIEYGADATYGTSASALPSQITQSYAGTGSFKVELGMLHYATTYHYRARVIDAKGTHYGADRTFTTDETKSFGPVWCSDAPVTFTAWPFLSSPRYFDTGWFPGNVAEAAPTVTALTPSEHGSTSTNGTTITYKPGPTFADEDSFRVKIEFKTPAVILEGYRDRFAPFIVNVRVRRPHEPNATTLAATVGSNIEAQLNANVAADGPNAKASFEYGLDDNYGNEAPLNVTVSDSATTIEQTVALRRLEPGTTYHFRVKASNDLGAVVGEDVTFTTPSTVDGGTLVCNELGTAFSGAFHVPLPWTDLDEFQRNQVYAENALGAACGSVEIDPFHGSTITYAPGASYAGSDSFTYDVTCERYPDRVRISTHPSYRVRVQMRSVKSLTSVVRVQAADDQGALNTLTGQDLGPYGAVVPSGRAKSGAIFREDGVMTLKAGDPAMGIDGNTILKIGAPSGRAALATLDQPYYDGFKNDTVLLTDLDTTPRVAAREGDSFADGSELKRIGAFDGNGSAIFFLATLGGRGVSAANNLALCAALPGGTTKILVRKGQNYGPAKITAFATLVGSPGSLAEERWRVSDHSIGVRLTFQGGAQALCVIPTEATSPSQWTILVGTWNQPFSDTADVRFASFGLPAFGPHGAAFRATLAGNATISVPKRANEGIFSITPTGLHLLALEGHSTGSSGNSYRTFSDPVMGDHGIAFLSKVMADEPGTPDRAGVFYAADGVTVHCLALSGYSYASFTSLVLPDGPTGSPLFTAALLIDKSNGITAKNNSVLYGLDSTGTLQLLLQPGQTLALPGGDKKVASFSALTAEAGSIGAAHGYDDDQNVAALVTFEDRTQAVVKIHVP